MKKQKQAPFPDDNQGEVPMSTNGLIRPTVNSAAGKSVLTRAKGTPKVAGANPYAGSSRDEHESFLGF